MSTPITEPQPADAMRRAMELAAALRERHYIEADVHQLASGEVAVSVYRGLFVKSNGKIFRWTSPERVHGKPLHTWAVGLSPAARRIAKHYEILLSRHLASKLEETVSWLAGSVNAHEAAPREEPVVTSPHGLPDSDQPDVAEWKPGAATVLQHLRAAFHTHLVYPSIAYDQGAPRLVISADMTAWANPEGTVICWGPTYMEEPAEQGLAMNPEDIARRIVEKLVEHESAMATH